jgi:hypothetical protein
MRIKMTIKVLIALFVAALAFWLADRQLIALIRNREEKLRSSITSENLIGSPLPNYSVMLHDGKSIVNPRKIVKGRKAVMVFFDPYCPHCRDQIREIITHKVEIDDIIFFFITSFPNSQMEAFIKEFSLDEYSNIIVGRDVHFQLEDYFKIKAVPYVAIYGEDMKLKHTHAGGMKFVEIIKLSTSVN